MAAIFSTYNAQKPVNGRGSTRTAGKLTAHHRPSNMWGGDRCPSLKKPTVLSYGSSQIDAADMCSPMKKILKMALPTIDRL